MATTSITRGKTLPDSGVKNDLHELIDLSTVTISNIVNADIDNSAAIAGSKITPNFGSQELIAGSATIDGVKLSNFDISTKTDDYEMLLTDFGKMITFNVSADKEFTLYDATASEDAYLIGIRNLGAYNITITPDGSDTAEIETLFAGCCAILQWDNTNTKWRKINVVGKTFGLETTDIHQDGGTGDALVAAAEYQALVTGEISGYATGSGSGTPYVTVSIGTSTGVLTVEQKSGQGNSDWNPFNMRINKGEFWKVDVNDASLTRITFRPIVE